MDSSASRFPQFHSPASHTTLAPTVRKKRKRVDARQFKALSKVLSRTQYPTTEEREQLATDLGMRPRRVQIWLAHAFVCAACIVTELSIVLSLRFQNQRQSLKRKAGRSPASRPTNQATTPNVAHPDGNPTPVSPLDESSYPFCYLLSDMTRSGPAPSPASDRPSADIDPCWQWPEPSPGN